MANGEVWQNWQTQRDQGKMHTYLGMIFDYRTKGKVRVDMRKFMSKMVTAFEKKYILNQKAPTPANVDPPDTGDLRLTARRHWSETMQFTYC